LHGLDRDAPPAAAGTWHLIHRPQFNRFRALLGARSRFAGLSTPHRQAAYTRAASIPILAVTAPIQTGPCDRAHHTVFHTVFSSQKGIPMNIRTLPRAAVLAAGALAFALSGALSAAPAHAAGQPAPKPALHGTVPPAVLALHQQRVPASAMPAPVRAALKAAHLSVSPNTTTTVVELVSSAYANKCVDANNAGPTAGLNGDVVQLWDCFNDQANHPNQWWWALQSNDGYTELINWQYGLCLDADNSQGFTNGSRVQLWSCFDDRTNHSNQWWNFGPHGFYTALPVTWGSASKVLDVNNYGPTAGQNGDKIQIWDYLGGSNQFWLQ
jgi:hypothetical protein